MSKFAFLDDDSGTFDGHPIKRFFRMRKWFFATALALLVIDTGWLDYATLAKFLALPDFPKEVLQTSLTYTGLYLIVQSSLVGIQIFATYQNSLLLRQTLIYGGLADQLREQIKDAEDQDQRDQLVLRLRHVEELSVSDRAENTIRWTETILDAMRILPTYGFLLYVTIRHGTLVF